MTIAAIPAAPTPAAAALNFAAIAATFFASLRSMVDDVNSATSEIAEPLSLLPALPGGSTFADAGDAFLAALPGLVNDANGMIAELALPCAPISPLPTVPSRSDDAAGFTPISALFVAALPQLRTDLNAFITALNAYSAIAHPVVVAPPSSSALYAAAYDTTNDWQLYDRSSTISITSNRAASLVKFATAILILQYKGSVLDSESVTATTADLATGGAQMGLTNGDVLTWRNLLYGLFLASGNDAAQCAARVIGTLIFTNAGSTGNTGVTRFVEAMNSLGTTLGLSSTTFTAPDAQWTTTALDIVKLAKAALAYPDIRTAASTVTRTITITGANARTFSLRNISELISGPIDNPTQGITYPDVLAAKTGFRFAVGDSAYSHLALWEAPSGQEVALVVVDCDSSRDAAQALLDMMDRLRTDFPYLAAGAFSFEDRVESGGERRVTSTGDVRVSATRIP